MTSEQLIFNAVTANLLALVITFLVRIFFFRPCLKFLSIFSAYRNKIDVFESGDGEATRFTFVAKMRNTGCQKLVRPSAYCMSVLNPNDVHKNSVAPFELPLSVNEKDGNTNALFPGVFEYDVVLGYVDKILDKNTKTWQVSNFFLSRKDKSVTTFEMLQSETYYLCLLIGNDNFMVPTHFCDLRISWSYNGEEPIVISNVISQGDYWLARIKCHTSKFDIVRV